MSTFLVKWQIKVSVIWYIKGNEKYWLHMENYRHLWPAKQILTIPKNCDYQKS